MRNLTSFGEKSRAVPEGYSVGMNRFLSGNLFPFCPDKLKVL
ncbi:hypothetical protein [Coleofasciculus sp. G2-EDA-02]